MIISATDIQNNFGKYLKLAEYEDIIITKNGREAARLTDCKVAETASGYSGTNVRVSYEEYLKLTNDTEHRYELIDGELHYLSSPLYLHQKAVKEIFGEFIYWFKGKKCEPLAAPFDVTLAKSDKNICVVQPDILVICDKEKIDKNGKYKGIPALVVEVLSEATSHKDNITKLDLYMSTGVREYWLVNTDSREVYIYVFENSKIKHVLSFNEKQRAESSCFAGLGVELAQIFT